MSLQVNFPTKDGETVCGHMLVHKHVMIAIISFVATKAHAIFVTNHRPLIAHILIIDTYAIVIPGICRP